MRDHIASELRKQYYLVGIVSDNTSGSIFIELLTIGELERGNTNHLIPRKLNEKIFSKMCNIR